MSVRGLAAGIGVDAVGERSALQEDDREARSSESIQHRGDLSTAKESCAVRARTSSARPSSTDGGQSPPCSVHSYVRRRGRRALARSHELRMLGRHLQRRPRNGLAPQNRPEHPDFRRRDGHRDRTLNADRPSLASIVEPPHSTQACPSRGSPAVSVNRTPNRRLQVT